MQRRGWIALLAALAGCGEISGSVLTPDEVTLSLLTPNGGESWPTGSNQTLSWSTAGDIGPVDLSYSVDGGTRFDSIASDLPPETTTFTWSVPSTPSDTVLVRVSQTEGPLSDTSDAPFAITSAVPSIRFESSTLTVEEDSTESVVLNLIVENSSSAFSLPYSVGGTASTSDHDLANGVLRVDAGATLATLSFDIVNDAEIEGDETVVVTLGSVSGITVGSPSVKTVTIADDDSAPDAPIVTLTQSSLTIEESVGQVTVTLAILNPGAAFSVPFTVGGTADTSDHDLVDGAVSVPASAASVDLTFNVLNDAVQEAAETITITLSDPTGANLGIPSALTVTILANDQPGVEIVSPNGGELFFVGDTANISWQSTGGSTPVDLLLSRDNGATWVVIALDQPATGTFPLFVTGPAVTTALIRATNGSAEDQSDSVFEIREGVLTVTSPTASTTWNEQSAQTVTWTSSDYTGSVDLAYSMNGGTSFVPIAFGETNDGSFDWQLPDEAGSAIVRVRASVEGGPSDDSESFILTPVSNEVLYVDAAALGSGDGSSWFNAFLQVEVAVAAASAGDEIWVAGGEYFVTSLAIPSDLRIYGGFSGTELTRGPRNPTANTTTLNATDLDAIIASVGSNTVLDGFDLINGDVFDGDGSGGAISVESASNVTLRRLVFLGNEAANRGGAISVVDAVVLVTRCTFDSNAGLNGAAIGMNGSTLRIEDSVFDRNVVTNFGLAAGISSFQSSIEIRRSTFSRNEGTDGGAFNLNESTLLLENVVLYDNRSDGLGGAILSDDSNVTISSSTFIQNESGLDSGASWNDRGGTLV
ncbi:MAG: Calx-beta domain-containing protein, partial [Myxococcota bacterium]